MKIGKKILIATVTLAVLLTASLTLAACNPNPSANNLNYLVKLSVLPKDYLGEGVEQIDVSPNIDASAKKEIYIPSAIDENRLGLFLNENDNGKIKYYKSTSKEAIDNFQPDKPVMIFIHGLTSSSSGATLASTAEKLAVKDSGVNVFTFRWNPFSDEAMPTLIEPKMWSTGGDINMRWRYPDENGDTQLETVDVPNVSLAEIFAAYYLDFLSRFDYTGSKIELVGHSMGGELSVAISSYLMAQERVGLINSDYIPDSVVLADPYVTGYTVVKDKCLWLDRTLNESILYKGEKVETTPVRNFSEEIKTMHERGINVLYLPAKNGFVYFSTSGDEVFCGTENIDRIYENTTAVLMTTDSVDFFNVDNFHYASYEYYYMTAGRGPLPDTALSGKEYTVSYETPFSYSYARTGTLYVNDGNMDYINPGDTIFYSTNVKNAKIAGFAFNDENGNGVYDERIKARVSGVSITLYSENGEAIATTETNDAGYYSFDLPAGSAEKIYYLKVDKLPDGYAITDKQGKELLMSNDFGVAEASTRKFSVDTDQSLCVLNVGLKATKTKGTLIGNILGK